MKIISAAHLTIGLGHNNILVAYLAKRLGPAVMILFPLEE